MPLQLPPLEYPVTRQFNSALLTASAYVLGFVTIVILAITNVALVGYDPMTVFHANFNVTQTFWFDRLIPVFAQTPGTLCDTRVFNIGESMVTNSSLFEWTVSAVDRPNAAESGFSYRGETLDHCDVHRVMLNGDIRTWTIEGDLHLYCNGQVGEGGAKGNSSQLEMAAVARFGVSALPTRRTNFQTMTKSASQDSVAIAMEGLFSMAGIDLGARAYEAYARTTPNSTGIVAFSVFASFVFCPPSLAAMVPCATAPPFIGFNVSTVITGGNMLLPFRAVADMGVADMGTPLDYDLGDALLGPTMNFLQLARAAARIDLGNPTENNFLLNPQATDEILVSSFPETPVTDLSQSRLYSAWKAQVNPVAKKPYHAFSVPGPSTLQAAFICHFFKLKGPGSLSVSVLVATLSMFSTAWTVFLWIATYFAKKGNRGANLCEDHKKESLLANVDLEKGSQEQPESPEPSLSPNIDAKMTRDPLLLYENPNL